ncbi:hypothetical protein TIFTF001_033476 [Ficus carica]|uniref:non-specific serine/threonine protein kinase n=1 Tax=Ficus carica TaxID=3494 RepID=A0AA88DYX5_FICCA|nr:hypothetical protein TIFTF001_033476 [Ficus carica]
MSGNIPPSLYNVSSMRVLSITDNHFSGIISPNIGLTLPNLQLCALSGNEFFGMIPESFSNASQLQVIDIGGNNFVGQIPSSFGNLPDLRWLLLGSNSLGSYSANSLDFITSLRNCSRMERLDFSLNNFGGILPTSVANLSTQISSLRFSDNKISGEIPTSLANLFNLIYLGMWNNLFTGSIPVSLCKLQNLGVFDLGTNALSGRIPLSIGNLTRIYALDLSYNKLEGTIPLDIGNCQMLQYLYLSGNKLDGSIPKEIFGLSSMLALEFSENAFSGNLQLEVHELKTVIVLNFANNNLIGKIPETIGDCQSLEFFDLHGNFFQGSLPSILSSLRGLQYLDLSQNNLTGQIPKDLQKLRFLSYFNLSFNDLYGEVPKDGVFQNTSELSLVGNTKLCGEYSMGGQPSREGDVYSYGILILEMFTRKRPTDEIFKDDFNLHNFVKIALPERLVQVVDSTLLLGEVEETAVRRESGRNWRNNGSIEVDAEGNINFENQYEIGTRLQKCLVSLLKIGLACSEDLPNQRMKMRDVTSELQHIRDAYLEVGIHG